MLVTYGKYLLIMEVYLVKDMLISFLFVALTCLATYFYTIFWLKPKGIRKKLVLQGLNGPPPSIFYGNLKDIVKIQKKIATKKHNNDADDRVSHEFGSYLFPHLHQWRQDYGMHNLTRFIRFCTLCRKKYKCFCFSLDSIIYIVRTFL